MATTPSTPAPAPGAANPAGGASTADILTTLKNVVLALNNAAQTYLNVNGLTNYPEISTDLGPYVLVKSSAGRVATMSVLSAGSTPGAIYDGLTGTKPLCIIPNVVGLYVVNMPANYGILVAPGTSQVLTVSYS